MPRMVGSGWLVGVWLVTASAGFSVALEAALPFDAPREVGVGNEPLAVIVGDLDGDGKNDLVFGAYGDDRLRIYPNRSVPGTIAVGVPIVVGSGIHPQGIALNCTGAHYTREVVPL